MENEALIFVLIIFMISFISASCSSTKVDINSASLTDLDKLTGIGPAKAQAIIDSRPYSSVEDLVNAYGIGPATLDKIKDQELACVDSEKEPEVDTEIGTQDEIQESKNPEPQTKETQVVTTEAITNTEEQNENIINLNSPSIPEEKEYEEIIYTSKNQKIKDYAIYGFCIFLVLIIIFLIFKK